MFVLCLWNSLYHNLYRGLVYICTVLEQCSVSADNPTQADLSKEPFTAYSLPAIIKGAVSKAVQGALWEFESKTSEQNIALQSAEQE